MEPQPRIPDVGYLSGSLLIFGGVYGNLQALQGLQAIASTLSIPAGNIFCTGDIGGYCAQPEECYELVRAWGIHAIAGNVELQLRDDAENCGCDFREGSRCDIFSRAWFPYTKSKISAATLEWLQTLPEQIFFGVGKKRFRMVHGSFFETAEYIFASTPWETKLKNMREANADVIIAGHSGLPFFQKHESLAWLNAGVIGMPANDGDTATWYALLDASDDGRITGRLCRLAYDHGLASSLMNAAHLPRQYAETLITGIWDNCEILPEIETHAQGVKIEPSSFLI